MKIKAVVFDAYGTLFDVYSIQTLAEQLYPGQGAAISVIWRDKQIEYTGLITQSDAHQAEGSKYYLPFWEITRRALDYTLDRLKLDRRGSAVEDLMLQYAHLKPFPENLAVLQKLQHKGLTTAILSNGSPEMLESAVTNAGMKDLLDHTISVDSIRLFKTHLKVTAWFKNSCRLKKKKYSLFPATAGMRWVQPGSDLQPFG